MCCTSSVNQPLVAMGRIKQHVCVPFCDNKEGTEIFSFLSQVCYDPSLHFFCYSFLQQEFTTICNGSVGDLQKIFPTREEQTGQ